MAVPVAAPHRDTIPATSDSFLLLSMTGKEPTPVGKTQVPNLVDLAGKRTSRRSPSSVSFSSHTSTKQTTLDTAARPRTAAHSTGGRRRGENRRLAAPSSPSSLCTSVHVPRELCLSPTRCFPSNASLTGFCMVVAARGCGYRASSLVDVSCFCLVGVPFSQLGGRRMEGWLEWFPGDSSTPLLSLRFLPSRWCRRP